MHPTLDVILIHHPTSNINRPILFPAMGLFSIANTLEEGGYRTQIVHLGLEEADFSIVDFVRRSGARLVGISAHWFFQLPDSLELAAMLKTALPELLVVFGGFSASFFAADIIRNHPAVDVVIRGDGELPLLQLAGETNKGSGPAAWANIANLVYRDASGATQLASQTHQIDSEAFGRSRFANLGLLHNHQRFLQMAFYPTGRFKDRFDFATGSIFPVETGRGCPFACTFCGGNREAQLLANLRHRPLYRPIPGVLQSLQEAMSYGIRNFYMCFDPVPNGEYYFDLFREIRKQRLEMRLIFGCWRLPDERFVDAFRETFVDGMFELSPETADEGLRHLNKGPLSYSNEDLDRCVSYIEQQDLVAQLFFGYFVAGDTVETVKRTLRFAHRFNRSNSEAFYLAFSTDPGSLIHLHPEKYDVDVRVQSLEDYLSALGEKRLTSNLLAHRPMAISADQAEQVINYIAIDQFAHKIAPRTLALIEQRLDNDATFAAMMDAVCESVADKISDDRQLSVVPMVRALEEAARDVDSLLEDLVAFETLPYLVMEEEFGAVSTHYSVVCRPYNLPAEEIERRLAESPSNFAIRKSMFRCNVEDALAQSEAIVLQARPTKIVLIVDNDGYFAALHSEPTTNAN